MSDPIEEEDCDICATCNGSGEGIADGTRCLQCQGSGSARGWAGCKQLDPDDDPRNERQDDNPEDDYHNDDAN